MPQSNRVVNFESDIIEQIDLAQRGKQKVRKLSFSTNFISVLKTLFCITCLAISVTIILKFVSVEAKIADYEFQRQQLTAVLQQSKLDCAQLEVDIAQLDNATRFDKIASANNLYYPSPEDISYISNTNDFPKIASSSATNAQANDNWAVAASKQVASGFSTILYRINLAGNPAAFAQ